MLTSICRNERKAYADIALKSDAPFKCPMCGNETILRKGKVKIHHFAHKPPVSCEYGKGESEAHRKCKQSIYSCLKQDPNVSECELEKNFGKVVSDVFFIHNGVKIAIEVQISNLTMDRIIERTKAYHDLGVYVLWLCLFDSNLNNECYSPKLWERWLHVNYYGRVYYWIEDLSLVPIHFEDYLLWVEQTEYGGGYHRVSKRYKTPRKGSIVNILKDFKFVNRESWKGGNIDVPRCKIMLDTKKSWWKK